MGLRWGRSSQAATSLLKKTSSRECEARKKDPLTWLHPGHIFYVINVGFGLYPSHERMIDLLSPYQPFDDEAIAFKTVQTEGRKMLGASRIVQSGERWNPTVDVAQGDRSFFRVKDTTGTFTVPSCLHILWVTFSAIHILVRSAVCSVGNPLRYRQAEKREHELLRHN